MKLSEAISHVPAHPGFSARRNNAFGGYDSLFNEGNGQLHAYRTRKPPSHPSLVDYIYVTPDTDNTSEAETFFACNGGDCDQRDWYIL